MSLRFFRGLIFFLSRFLKKSSKFQIRSHRHPSYNMNGVNSSRDVCIGNSRAAAFSSRFVWVTVTSGCAVEKMLHKEDVLGGGKLKTCKLSTLVSSLW